jgi:hypothetical protein
MSPDVTDESSGAEEESSGAEESSPDESSPDGTELLSGGRVSPVSRGGLSLGGNVHANANAMKTNGALAGR